MLKIALAKGRIANVFYNLIKESGSEWNSIDLKSRKLVLDISNEYRIILAKSNDVINLVATGFADLGITGSDTILEMNNANIVELMDLEVGICKFVLATMPNCTLKSIKRVATKYPNIARKLLKELGMNSQIIKMEGSLELAPIINYADAIIDLVETGITLKENGLIPIKECQQISSKVIVRYENQEKEEIQSFIRKLEKRKEEQK